MVVESHLNTGGETSTEKCLERRAVAKRQKVTMVRQNGEVWVENIFVLLVVDVRRVVLEH